MTTVGDLIRITRVTEDTAPFLTVGSVWPVRMVTNHDGHEGLLLSNPFATDKWEAYPVLATADGEAWELYS